MKLAKSIIQWALLSILIAVLVVLVLFRGLVADGIRAVQYQPSPQAEQISHNVEFTWLGKLYFYASSPVIDQTSRASEECGVEKSTAILGCYADGVIYIYDIDNTELKGVEEVTAAHEMLHAAYSRLDERERNRVNGLLERETSKLQDDTVFTERLEAYDDLNKADRLNELHSILGTEVRDLSAALETYYSRYFNDRGRIAKTYREYSSIFFQLEAEMEELAKAYNQLIKERNQVVTIMNQRYDELQARIVSARQSSEVSAAVAQSINQDIARYNQALATARQQLAQYDQRLSELREKIEDSAAHQQQLNQTIDSSLAPAAQL